MENLTPGIDRAYTTEEFCNMVIDKVKKKHPFFCQMLDYISASWDTRTVLMGTPWISFRHKTDFGGSEGIYSSFFVTEDSGKERQIMTAKTLLDDDEAYILMNTLAAMIVVMLKRLAEEKIAELCWTGYNVGIMKEGSIRWDYCCVPDYKKCADIRLNAEQEVYIRNNVTREIMPYK